MKWDDFVGKPTKPSWKEGTAAVGDLTVAIAENLCLSQEEEEMEEHDRPVTPPAQIQATGLFSDDAPPSSKLDSFVIEERRKCFQCELEHPPFPLPEQT